MHATIHTASSTSSDTMGILPARAAGIRCRGPEPHLPPRARGGATDGRTAPFRKRASESRVCFHPELYGEILEYPENSPDASIFVHFKEVSDVSIRISPRSLDNLARHLRSLTDESSQSDPEQFVSLLSKVAFIAGQAGLRVDRPSTNQRMLNQIVQAIRTDFSLACVKVLAHSSGLFDDYQSGSGGSDILGPSRARSREADPGIPSVSPHAAGSGRG